MKIMLVEELAGRERLALMALRRELQQRGHEVEMSNSWRIVPDLRRLRPDLVADNISDAVAHFIGKYRGMPKSTCNVNLMWEQLPSPMTLRRYRLDPILQSGLVDGRVAWGRGFQDFLLFNNPLLSKERVKVTGSLKHGLHSLYKTVSREDVAEVFGIDIKPYSQIVLFADSFQPAMTQPKTLHGHRISHNRDSPFAYEFSLWAKATQREAFDMLHGLATANPDTLFIVRMHPSKRASYVRQHQDLEGAPNITVNTSGEFTALLHLADLLIASRSGALVDAYFMSCPAINVRPEHSPLDATHVTWAPQDEFGRRFSAQEAIETGLNELTSMPTRSPNQNQIASYWFGPQDGRCYERTSTFIETIHEKGPTSHRVPLQALLTRRNAKHHPLNQWAKNQVKSLTGRTGRAPVDQFPYDKLYALLTGDEDATDPA